VGRGRRGAGAATASSRHAGEHRTEIVSLQDDGLTEVCRQPGTHRRPREPASNAWGVADALAGRYHQRPAHVGPQKPQAKRSRRSRRAALTAAARGRERADRQGLRPPLVSASRRSARAAGKQSGGHARSRSRCVLRRRAGARGGWSGSARAGARVPYRMVNGRGNTITRSGLTADNAVADFGRRLKNRLPRRDR